MTDRDNSQEHPYVEQRPLDSVGDVSIHAGSHHQDPASLSHDQDPTSLREFINIRDNPSNTTSLTTEGSRSNNEPFTERTATQEARATPERFQITGTARHFDEPPRGDILTNEPTRISSGLASDGLNFQIEQTTEALRREGASERHASNVQSDEHLQTSPKFIASNDGALAGSNSQRACARADGEETGQNAAAAGMDSWSVERECCQPHDAADFDFLLIGKTGNGKSATGNSILLRRVFKASNRTRSVTERIQYGFCKFKGKTIKVVDSPGVEDTRSGVDKSDSNIQELMKYAIVCNPRGYNAFILVFKYGARYTSEERKVIAFLKDVFGSDFIRNFCIMVVTWGDAFERDMEDGNLDFKEWLLDKDHDQDFKDLVKELENRVVLFDNYTKDAIKKESQMDELLKLVDELKDKHRYTNNIFEEVARKREELKYEKGKGIVLSEEFSKKLCLVFQKFNNILNSHSPEEQVQPLQELSAETECLCQELCQFDECEHSKNLVQLLKNWLEREKNLLSKRLDDKEGYEKEQKKRLREMEEQSQECQEAKCRRDHCFFSHVVETIKWPFKQVMGELYLHPVE